MKKCPACKEDIHNNARKCPHCKEYISTNMIEKLSKKIAIFIDKKIQVKTLIKHVRHFLNLIVAALASCIVLISFRLLKMPLFPYIWLMAFLVFFVVLIAFIRPLSIQISTLLALITLVFLGLNVLWQKESFDLRNRPFLKVLPLTIQITDKSRLMKDPLRLEPQFAGSTSLINYGPVPAYIKDVIIKVSNNPDFNDLIPIGAFIEDRIWKNFDVFPGEKNKSDFDITFYLNFNHIKKLLGANFENIIDITTVDNRMTPHKLIKTPEYKNREGDLNYSFYSITQVRYYILGANLASNPYWYWVKYHTFIDEDNKLQYQFLASGTEKVLD